MKKQQAPCRPSTLGKKGFAGIPISVMESPAYRGLHLRSRAILFEIAARMNGYNNGKIVLSYEQIRDSTKCCNRDIAKAMDQLWQHGLIEFRECENWVQRKAREYRLTFVSTVSGSIILPATNDYLTWTPPPIAKAKRKKLGDTVQPATPCAGDTLQPTTHFAGDTVQPAKKAKQRKTAKNAIRDRLGAGDTVLPHIYNHGSEAEKPSPPRPSRGQGASVGDAHNDCQYQRCSTGDDVKTIGSLAADILNRAAG